MTLKDKVIVITGGSRGLGKELAREFFQNGAKVIITARNKKELEKTAKEIGVLSFVSDVTNEISLKKLSAFVLKKFGKIDFWINNVGIWIPHSSIENVKIKDLQKAIDVNVFGMIYGSRIAISAMKKKKTGAIINIISLSGLNGRPMSSAYATSKWAARGFSESLRLALEPLHIPVIAIYQGGMKTDIFKNKKPKDYDTFMEPNYVAKKIVSNLKLKKPKIDLIISK